MKMIGIGNPPIHAETRCPIAAANPAAGAGKKTAPKNAGAESRAAELIPTGILIMAPTAHNADIIAVNVIIRNFIFI